MDVAMVTDVNIHDAVIWSHDQIVYVAMVTDVNIRDAVIWSRDQINSI